MLDLIYIPVWLDQKYVIILFVLFLYHYLHSSMVRLEIKTRPSAPCHTRSFTFQYGQIRNFNIVFTYFYIHEIYIPVWLDQKSCSYLHSSMVRLEIHLLFEVLLSFRHLHSSMVRLEIFPFFTPLYSRVAFTFQYGQIRNL